MADSSDRSASSLLCDENPETMFGDVDSGNAMDEWSPSWDQRNHQNPNFENNDSQRLVWLPMMSEECLTEMFEKEREFLPRDDYLHRLRIGELELGGRREALDWIWKAHAHFNFGPLCVCLSVNYFDRVLSVYDIPRGQSWISQLLAVTCVLLAAKVEERNLPVCVDFQVGDPKVVFEGNSIERMENLVLRTLNWRMKTITPYSFIDYFLHKISGDQPPLNLLVSRSVQLILSTVKGIDFLEFRPSEVAAAVAISVSGELQALDIDTVMSSFIHVEKGRVLKCLELLKDLSLTSGSANVASAPALSLAQSPAGVLDAACLSSKSNDLTIGSCSKSSHNGPDKRRRLD